MTLEECIEYFETEAETSDSLMVPYEPRKKYSDDCKQMADWLRELQSIREIVRDTEIGFDNATDHVEREEVISDGYFRVEKVIHEDKGYIEWLEGSDSE